MNAGDVLYRGYVDDHRNTDNAWFSTEARHVHLTGVAAQQEPVASDDVSAARWVDLDAIRPADLYASHGHIVAPLLTEKPTLGHRLKQDVQVAIADGVAAGDRDAERVLAAGARAFGKLRNLLRR